MSYLVSLFEQHSYLILFLGIFLELMALPISGEFLMSYAGYFVYQGKMNYFLALFTVFLSGGIGITVTYWIGRAGGYKLVEKYGKYIHLGPKRYEKVASWFERSGSKLLVFAYFIPGVRHFTGYVSGISRIPFRKFLIPAYIGSFLWGFCFITLGRVLGPKWKMFHDAAGKYFLIFIVVLVLLTLGYLAYYFYKNQIKNFFILFIKKLIHRLKTIKATEIFLIFLTVALIGMVILMLGLAQDYLYNDFAQFNQITIYVIKHVIYIGGLHVFLIFQSLYALILISILTVFVIWRNGRNRSLEFLLFIISILGTKPFCDSVKKIFDYLQSIGFVGKFHSANFPDLHSTFMITLYGTCIFLLVRHSERIYIPFCITLFGLVIVMGLAVVNIASMNLLPSDIAGGYVYGCVWIFFNFLLFEMQRLVLDKKRSI